METVPLCPELRCLWEEKAYMESLSQILEVHEKIAMILPTKNFYFYKVLAPSQSQKLQSLYSQLSF